MILINKQYATQIQHINTTKTANSNTEITIAKIRPKRLPRGYGSCYVVCAYITPTSATKNNRKKFNEVETNIIAQQVATALDEDKSTNKHLLFICGDFNGATSSSLCRQLQVEQINTAPTRKKKLLDPLFTNEPTIYNSYNKQIFKSDHRTVIAHPIRQRYKQEQSKKEVITIRSGKIEDTVNQIEAIDWNELIQIKADPQSKFDVFYNTINSIQDTCQPYKTTTMKDDQPWMTPNIKQMIRKRQKLYNQSYTDDDNSKWRKLANTIRYKITQRKRQYFSCFKNKDSKKWWKVVNNFNGKGKRKEDISLTVEELNEGFHQVWSNGTRTDLSSFITTTNQIPYNITPYAVLQELNKLDTSTTSSSKVPDMSFATS